MNKNRLEAFSDGVLAIIITIMVLELKTPEGTNFNALLKLFPIFISYVLSFIYVGIYWNNHHHMMHTVKKVTGGILWANLHLLFWLSLIPFATAWIGEHNFAPFPMFSYGFVLLMCGVAYNILQNQIIKTQGENSLLSKAVGKDFKGKISPVLYLVAILSTYYHEVFSGIIYILVALMWLIPDKRIEKIIDNE
ncbi:TMEM175 family protein [Flavobacterium amniphilum]|uniref:TMEM175 family protein n=1 Tax=Flavobacterium amniphilum TaxID=1834035 RepID=UPI002029C440|nr:TMEM175 family protein [Flavobacterium amniphilum]MCL9804352.1 TMEM175 family protein [Flavobacterium amniphilum]